MGANFQDDNATSFTSYSDGNLAQDIDVTEDVLQSFTVPNLISVSGTTIDSNGVAVANVAINVFSFGADNIELFANTTSDEQGNYNLLLLPADYNITLEPQQEDTSYGRTTYTAIEFSESTTNDLIVDQVTRNTISGTITLSDGTPVSGATLRATPQSGGQSGRTTTDENGAYSITLLSGVYRTHFGCKLPRR